eukprot:488722-Rhodomonas_salina.3
MMPGFRQILSSFRDAKTYDLNQVPAGGPRLKPEAQGWQDWRKGRYRKHHLCSSWDAGTKSANCTSTKETKTLHALTLSGWHLLQVQVHCQVQSFHHHHHHGMAAASHLPCPPPSPWAAAGQDGTRPERPLET